jgi:CDGSH-type Zn-finger protein/uncharacterized Fe-S cluster protein YjdI
MIRHTKSYRGNDIEITYDAKRCIHAGECAKGLPAVFDPNKKPWVDPGQASAAEIAKVIDRCPSGALHYKGKGVPQEAPPAENTVVLGPDGPLIARGNIQVVRDGRVVLEDTRVTFCRCGYSNDKPFCDNAHVKEEFTDAGMVSQELHAAAEDEGVLEITIRPDGPLLFRGPCVIVDAEGTRLPLQEKGAFCRCGGSSNKPFCDGNHAVIEFEAE